MGKRVLHELLAVEGDLEGLHKRILEETKNTFAKKADHFFGQHRKLQMFVDDGIEYPEDYKALVTTVQDKLDYLAMTEIRYFDALLGKEATNQTATADLIVDDVVIGKNLPATFLLGMETRVKYLRAAYEAIPTLAPGITWVKDESEGANIYKADRPDEKLKTETVVEPIVLYEATKEHPAQIKEVSKTKNVGKYVTVTWSGMVTPAHKSALLSRVDKLLQGLKQARQRANTTVVVSKTIGKEMFDYINAY